MKQKRALMLILWSLFLSGLVSAVEIVQNVDTTPKTLEPTPTSAWTYIMWALLGILILVLILGGLTYVVWKILQWLKQRESEFHNIMVQKRDLVRSHASKQYYRSLLSRAKNAPIKCLSKDNSTGEGKLKLTTIGYYYGHYYSNEGTLFIAFSNSPIHFLLWFIPKIEVILINKNPVRRIKIKEEKKMVDGKQKIKEIYREVALPTNIEHFQDDEIILYCYGIDNLRTEEDVYTPVLFNEATGEVLPSNIFMWNVMEKILLQDVLFTQAEGYARNTKKSLDINTGLRASQKLSDSNQEVKEQQ